MKEKVRLDLLIYNRGLAKSREKAKQLVVSGSVYIEGKPIKKPGIMVNDDINIELSLNTEQYVSRGAYKLKKAIEVFQIDLKDRIAADIGASTGGFTDYMLKNGCKKVYAIDVGQNQLDKSLLSDSRVVALDKTNFRYIEKTIFNDDIDFISIDVSFISLMYILPNVYETASNEADIVALVKPQFEAGKENIGKKGIVKDKKVHEMVLQKVFGYCSDNNIIVSGLTYSPIAGGDGNIEYLLHIKKSYNFSLNNNKINLNLRQAIDDAFRDLKNKK